MMFDDKKLAKVRSAFLVDQETAQEIASAFRYDIRMGLNEPERSSLQMLQAYVDLPNGEETGEYLALDFGGTNVRAMRIKLLGGGKHMVVKSVAKPLVRPGVYDHIGPGSTAEGLFDFLAHLIDEVAGGDRETLFLLGHTFSFPMKKTAINDAVLVGWTKEIQTEGVEGKDVSLLLKDALVHIGATNIEPVAVVNDTVALLLAAAYEYGNTYIGSIYATGHNTCYFEPRQNTTIINMESGGFVKLVPNKYDNMVDEKSDRPGEQRLEKMVSGRYLGELFGLALADVLGENKDYGFTSIDLSAMIADDSDDRTEVARIIEEKTGKRFEPEDCEELRLLAEAVVIRSARIVSATWAGLFWHLDSEDRGGNQRIAIDGSIYEKMPLVKENVLRTLYDVLGEDAAKLEPVLVKGGSGLGAAIAAALSQKD